VTTISFSLPKKEYVKLTITDISGRLVKTLINSTQHAGKHTVRFDGSDMASGIYLYTLKTQDKVITKKLTLLK
ncbi:T9SS C-terminal target domain-containing protein, partial [candidate division KSB1 bacterium]